MPPKAAGGKHKSTMHLAEVQIIGKRGSSMSTSRVVASGFEGRRSSVRFFEFGRVVKFY